MIDWITQYQSILMGFAGGVLSVVTALVTLRFTHSNRITRVETKIDAINQRLDRLQNEMDALKTRGDSLFERTNRMRSIEDAADWVQRFREVVAKAEALADELKNTIAALKLGDQSNASPPIPTKDVSKPKKPKARTPRTKKKDADIAPKPKNKSKAKPRIDIKEMPKPKRSKPLRSRKTNTKT